jgi:2'-5' RNA ligase
MKERHSESIRTFIAIAIPAVIQQKIAAICTPLAALPDRITWVKPQNLHFTLKFLGEISVGRVQRLKVTLKQAAQGCKPFPVDFTNIGIFPNAKRPRVIWLGLGDPTAQLVKLYQELEENLRVCGFVPENRKFKPHLTLGRIRRLKNREQLISSLHSLPLPKLDQLKVTQVSLIRSQLQPQGPIYTELYSAQLGGL